MNNQIRAYGSLTISNFKMYVRNPVASSSLFLALLVLLFLFKIVFDSPGPHTRLVVVDASNGAAAILIGDLRSVSSFDVTEASEASARVLLSQGKVDLEVVIPPSFGQQDSSGRPAPVSLEVTYRAGTAGETSLPLLKATVDSYDQNVLKEVPTISVSTAALHTRSAGPIDFLLPGIVAFNIIGSGLMLAAGTFSNYKSTGVLRRLKATGISPSIFVLAHATSSFAMGALQTAAILVAASLLFSVHLDLVSLFLLLVVAYLVFLGMGLAIAGWIKDPQRATAVAQSIAFPMIFIALLSAALPPGIARITKYLPVSYVTDGMQQLGQGANLAAIEVDLVWLLAWAIVLLIAAGRVFRWD
ncbi:MAG TPA: ABC transporter permease [Candidatus Limnocylindrales bacterium]|nr:ABC transporter permease [Candidatus Limnocylindrales bacterium]